MTRVPLREIDVTDPTTAAAARSFERENRAPIDLYRALANAPRLLGGFHELSDALRYRAHVPRLLRELAILRTAYLTGSEYEWAHHVGMALAVGAGQEHIRDIPGWADSGAFSAVQRAVLSLADQMHAVQVSDGTFAAVATATSAEEATELVVLCAHYQGVARIIQALGVATESAYATVAALPERLAARTKLARAKNDELRKTQKERQGAMTTTATARRRSEALILNTRPREDLLRNAQREAGLRQLHRFPIFDVDCHVIETMHLSDIVPYIQNEAIRDRYEHVPAAAALNLPSAYGDKDVAGRIYRDEHVPGTRGVPRIEDLIRDLRRMGVNAASVFPTPMLALGEHPEVAVETALGQAYNRWLIDHCLQQEPALKAMLYLPFNDPEAALREVEQLGDAPGVVGFLVTSVRRNPVYHNDFLPVYAALEERNLPIGFHGGVNWTKATVSGSLNRFLTVHALDFPLYNMVHLFNVIINGLPERFPRLKWLFYEAGLAWLVFAALRLDNEFMMRPSEAPLLKRKPSEYMRDMYFGTQPMEYPARMEHLEMIFEMLDGANHFLYASDYPHWDFDLPSRIYDLPFLSEEDKRKILGGNAMQVFGIDPASLEPTGSE